MEKPAFIVNAFTVCSCVQLVLSTLSGYFRRQIKANILGGSRERLDESSQVKLNQVEFIVICSYSEVQ